MINPLTGALILTGKPLPRDAVPVTKLTGQSEDKKSWWQSVAGFLIAGAVVVPLVTAGAKMIDLTGNWAHGAGLFAGVTAWGAIEATIRGE